MSAPRPAHRAPTEAERHDAGQARLVAVVMTAAMVLWLGLSWLGGRLGWDPAYAFLFDLAAVAAFVWSLAVTWRIWQRRRS